MSHHTHRRTVAICYCTACKSKTFCPDPLSHLFAFARARCQHCNHPIGAEIYLDAHKRELTDSKFTDIPAHATWSLSIPGATCPRCKLDTVYDPPKTVQDALLTPCQHCDFKVPTALLSEANRRQN